MFLYLLIIGLLVVLLHYYFKYRSKIVTQVPSPPPTFFFGNGLELILSPVELFKLGRTYASSFDGIYGWYCFDIQVINPYNPEDIEAVISSSKNTDKSIIYYILKPWLKEGLLVSSGSKWTHRRKILTPTFHFNILKRFVSVMEENSRGLVASLTKTKGEPVDIVPVISTYTLNGICETAMGTRLDKEISKEGNVYKRSLNEVSRLCAERMARVYYIFDPIFRLSIIGRNFYKHLEKVTNFTKRVIKLRKEYLEATGIDFKDSMEDDEDNVYLNSKRKKVAMLDLMISAEKEGVIGSDGIQEEVDTFMFEGHDTTASGLDFCLMSLANHKDVQEKIFKELKEVFGDSDRPATIDDLNALKYLECCIKESLRLYPPVPFIGRKLTDPVVLSGYTIPAGVQCHIHVYDLHRNEKVYPEPEKYDPDRFLPENCVTRHPYAFIPFSAGPRNCIGQRFAMLEMKSCLASLLRKFRLEPVTKPEDLEFMADLVLRNTKPVYVKFIERKFS
ncbi:cytochrome p450 domain-containing protein [Phthorimaea operculella]|nr:cytochrome p450 domain-containing protein [Phthorimaea operculella]